MKFKHIKGTSIAIIAGVMIALAGCTDQQPVQVNNYYITNSDGNVQSAIPDVNVPTVSTESKVDNSSTTSQVVSSESKATNVTVNTDSNLVVGITYTVTGTKNYLALRNAPAYDGSNEIAKLKNGDEVTIQSQNVYGDKNEYCYVTALSGSASGQSGYVNKAYLTPSTNKSNNNSVNSISQNKDVSSKNDVESKVNSNTFSKEESHTESEVLHQTESTLPAADASNIFEMIPAEFCFSSGAGGWRTIVTINSDGSFVGDYVDYDLGDTGSDYPKGSAYKCNFTGHFTNVTKIDDYTYSMKVVSLEQDGTQGDEYIEDGTRFTIGYPYGFDDADEFMLYLPGKPISELSDEFLMWIQINRDAQDTLPNDIYGLYNVNGKQGFRGDDNN